MFAVMLCVSFAFVSEPASLSPAQIEWLQKHYKPNVVTVFAEVETVVGAPEDVQSGQEIRADRGASFALAPDTPDHLLDFTAVVHQGKVYWLSPGALEQFEWEGAGLVAATLREDCVLLVTVYCFLGPLVVYFILTRWKRPRQSAENHVKEMAILGVIFLVVGGSIIDQCGSAFNTMGNDMFVLLLIGCVLVWLTYLLKQWNITPEVLEEQTT